jgi:hypothetical protein
LAGLFIGFLIFGVGGVMIGLATIREPVGITLLVGGIVSGGTSSFAYKGWKNKQSQANRMKPAPGCEVVPVVYVEWSGSVHIFKLANAAFYEQFRQANAGKVLG